MRPPRELEAIEGRLSQLFQRFVPIAGDAPLEESCAEIAAGNARLRPAEQVDIYRHQFWLRHRDSLAEDYPALKEVIGNDAFEGFIKAYLAAHPPRTPSLRDLGADIVSFAQSYEFDPRLRELPVDVVRYELAFVEAFDGPDPDPLDVQVIESMPPEAWNEAKIVLNPCVARLALHHPVHHLRYAVKAGEPPPAMTRVDEGVFVALFRHNNIVRFEELSRAQLALLDALGEGVPLVPACARITEGEPDEVVAHIQASIGGWFAQWARAGFIARIEVPRNSAEAP
jgi:Putative DNA-binding domain